MPCAKCGKVLVGSVVQALGKEYHKDCFGCDGKLVLLYLIQTITNHIYFSVCGKAFPGGSFFTNHGKPVCEEHA
jgi:hypothetical protein